MKYSDDGYELLSRIEIEKGMPVILVTKRPHYSIGPSNPLVNTKHECEGTVIGVDEDEIRVRWANGKSNSYTDYDLAPSNKSCIGRCKSIWSSI